MAENPHMGNVPLKRHEVARPVHMQRLEAAVDIRLFIDHVEKVLSAEGKSDSDEDSDVKSTGEMSKGDKIVHGVVTTKQERLSDRLRLYNFSSVGNEREWLRNALLSSSDSDSSSEDDTSHARDKRIKQMLSEHVFRKKYVAKYYNNPAKSHYMYYGAGLLSTVDRYPERCISQPPVPSSSAASTSRGRRGRPTERGQSSRMQNNSSNMQSNRNDTDGVDGIDFEEQITQFQNIKQDKKEKQDSTEQPDSDFNSKAAIRARKKAAAAKSPEALTARRRRHWQLMAKKELGKVHRARAQAHKDSMLQRKRLATLCCKHWRAKAMQSQKNMKETIWRCKRLSREMQAYWRRYDRAERETRRRMEKEAEEQRKMDVELMEAKRQRRKLNFLITQTELYAHFMQRKLSTDSSDGDTSADHILHQLDEDRDPRLIAIDHYDSEEMKAKACQNAREAFRVDRARTQLFDVAASTSTDPETPTATDRGDYDQPSIFRGTLKGYQLKGMNWLANLYDQGISGILADEMGLGKTVQCIAFLCHVAERLGVWGPFLVVSPASTLHNWQQELQRFIPHFKVVPYWGSPSERKILRQFWERKDLHTPSAAFHVVVTSYQLVVSDFKYLNRVSWQYMILDEAQAIKSSASMRWKLLLGFNCRNRLLLSGTPIQNSMAELWALLHFIMPTLFDSHDEFNEWFSKDIESHAENKTTIDEKHLSRLHMILKPFMLRRIKKDVENELSDKIEIMVHCPLTIRQKLLYISLKKKIKVEELLHFSGGNETGHSIDKNFTSNLMNLVMQFRKVCNHPELFERRDVRSPFAMHCEDYHIPKLVAEDGILMHSMPSKRHLLYNKYCIHREEYVHRSSNGGGMFAFTRFMDMSPTDICMVMLGGWLLVMQHLENLQVKYDKLRHRQYWWCEHYQSMCTANAEASQGHNDTVGYYDKTFSKDLLLICPGGEVLQQRKQDGQIWKDLLFVDPVWSNASGVVYAHADHTIHYTPETIEHRAMRRRHTLGLSRDDEAQELLQEIKTEEGGVALIKTEPLEQEEWQHVERDPIVRPMEPTTLPAFLYHPICKASSFTRRIYAESRRAAFAQIRHEHCENAEGCDMVTQLVAASRHPVGWSTLQVPDKNQLVSDAGKLTVLDSLLKRLKEGGHRVLIYSQMTKMIDLLEEYMWHRKHKYMRLDGSSKISARRDMVADFQARADIFVFLLSTRAGGLGINLTAADTVIFYDSDWNPTVDQQAMDRAHRLGQTKQVTVYRLICKGTIEERIMERAREKSEIQRMVISGGNFKPDSLKPKEVVSLLLDDEEIEQKYPHNSEERRSSEDGPPADKERKRKLGLPLKSFSVDAKRAKEDVPDAGGSDESCPVSPGAEEDDSNDALVVDDPPTSPQQTLSAFSSSGWGASRRALGRSTTRRGRPRGSKNLFTKANPRPNAPQPTPDEMAVAVASGAALLQSDDLESTESTNKCKRGPGRPRVRPTVPAAVRGTQPTRRPRKPGLPLLVPLASSIPRQPAAQAKPSTSGCK